MTNDEILEYNKKCAEFLGLKIENNFITNTYGIESFFPLLGYSRPIGELEFHYNWNWIMEVVEAIEKLPDLYGRRNCRYVFDISNDAIVDNKHTITITQSVSITKGFKQERIVTVYRVDYKKEAVVQAINDFLIWYNKNK